MTTRGIRILHLEDNNFDAELVREGLLRGGIHCTIDQVWTKEHFVGALKDVPYDLIISDFSMAGFDGEAALSLAGEIQPEVPIIVYSGTPQDDARLDRLRIRAKEIVPKGRLADLVGAVKDTLASGRRTTNKLPLEQWNREARRFLEILVTENLDGVVAFDENRFITYWNRAMESIYGLSAEEALGQPLIDIFMRVKRNGEDMLLYKLVQGSPVTSQECSHLHQKTRNIVYTETHFWPLREANNGNAGGIVLVRDITARKRLDQARKHVDAAFHQLFNEAPAGLFVTNLQGRLLYTNQKLRRLIARSSEELAGISIQELLSEEGRKTWDMVARDLVYIRETEMETLVSRKGDGLFEATISMSMAGTNQIVAVVIDSSERISLENRLRISEESFRSFCEHAGDMVFSVSPEGRVTFISTEFSKVTGWSKFVWLGNELFPLVHPDDVSLLRYSIECVLNGKPLRPFRLRIRRIDGAYFSGECSCSPLLQRNAISGVWSVVREIEEAPLFESHVHHELN